MTGPRIPLSTYRLQFNSGFTFDQAAALVPYLARLGVTHVYASPYLKARAGSSHGYDIVDHNAFNPEIGDAESFERFVDVLARHGMAHILDLVPNHMGVFGNDNGWWLDVLENGPSSPFADFFDIDWHPRKEALRGKLLVPVLGDHYGTILENGELRLDFDAQRGEFTLYYYAHQFPLDPRTYPRILEHDLARLEERLGADHPQLLELKTLMSSFSHLPARGAVGPTHQEERRRDKEIHKKHFAALCAACEPIVQFIEENVALFNGEPGNYQAFNPLHFLLEEQAFRLAFWLVAADEINYRRFFDINDLAGLRMEDERVFAQTHRLVMELIATGKLDGLRIDHPDGLYDPLAYYRRLNAEIAERTGERADDGPPRYLVVEKILAAYEHLSEEWPVHGTTGYDFTAQVDGLFVYAPAEREMNQVYFRFAGPRPGFDDLLYNRKKLIVRLQLSSELTVLAAMLGHIAERNRHTRDFTLNGCRDAITELTACFPVYRTYITAGRVSEDDRRYVDWAVAQAKKRSPAADITIFDFMRRILIEDTCLPDEGRRARATRFAMRFQQYTAPVMAKALEDTTFYLYNRLVSQNEVGGDPRRYGTSVSAFHHANTERLRRWPHSMVSTSTHDTKRSEDVRARVDVLSEAPAEWQRQVLRWARLNRSRKTQNDHTPAPSRNDEYLLYQTLVGTLPIPLPAGAALRAYRDRISAYMLKAVKEAKVHTSWINPNAEYENAVRQFVEGILIEEAPFFANLGAFVASQLRFGLCNALAQTVLRLTVPGVPDTYQGTELWSFLLVDPDNRAPVDYALRERVLDELTARAAAEPLSGLAAALFETIEDGRLKLFVIWRLLTLRRDLPGLFQAGDYVPIEIAGPAADHVCAFLRRHEGHYALVAVARWLYRFADGNPAACCDPERWAETVLVLPTELAGVAFNCRLTGAGIDSCQRNGFEAMLPCSALFCRLPVAVLTAALPP